MKTNAQWMQENGYKFSDPTDDIYLPRFRASDMYKGMEMYKKYRLEELGL